MSIWSSERDTDDGEEASFLIGNVLHLGLKAIERAGGRGTMANPAKGEKTGQRGLPNMGYRPGARARSVRPRLANGKAALQVHNPSQRQLATIGRTHTDTPFF
jgi:hypothetical protein